MDIILRDPENRSYFGKEQLEVHQEGGCQTSLRRRIWPVFWLVPFPYLSGSMLSKLDRMSTDVYNIHQFSINKTSPGQDVDSNIPRKKRTTYTLPELLHAKVASVMKPQTISQAGRNKDGRIRVWIICAGTIPIA